VDSHFGAHGRIIAEFCTGLDLDTGEGAHADPIRVRFQPDQQQSDLQRTTISKPDSTRSANAKVAVLVFANSNRNFAADDISQTWFAPLRREEGAEKPLKILFFVRKARLIRSDSANT